MQSNRSRKDSFRKNSREKERDRRENARRKETKRDKTDKTDRDYRAGVFKSYFIDTIYLLAIDNIIRYLGIIVVK